MPAFAAELRTTTEDAPVFPSMKGTPLADMTLTKILRDAKLPYTVHGFRSTFRDWAAEEMPQIPDAVAEAALAHVVPDKVVAAYALQARGGPPKHVWCLVRGCVRLAGDASSDGASDKEDHRLLTLVPMR